MSAALREQGFTVFAVDSPNNRHAAKLKPIALKSHPAIFPRNFAGSFASTSAFLHTSRIALRHM